MTKLDFDPDNDWPTVNLSAALRGMSTPFQTWVRSSPRRSLSPSGDLLILARERSWPGPRAMVVNRAPTSESDAICSLDLIWPNAASRVVLPKGGMVASIRLLDDDRIAATLRLSREVARELGLSESKIDVTLSKSRLHELPDPLIETPPLRSFRALLSTEGLPEVSPDTGGKDQDVGPAPGRQPISAGPSFARSRHRGAPKRDTAREERSWSQKHFSGRLL